MNFPLRNEFPLKRQQKDIPQEVFISICSGKAWSGKVLPIPWTTSFILFLFFLEEIKTLKGNPFPGVPARGDNESESRTTSLDWKQTRTSPGIACPHICHLSSTDVASSKLSNRPGMPGVNKKPSELYHQYYINGLRCKIWQSYWVNENKWQRNANIAVEITPLIWFNCPSTFIQDRKMLQI